jgi:hypothetical protein
MFSGGCTPRVTQVRGLACKQQPAWEAHRWTYVVKACDACAAHAQQQLLAGVGPPHVTQVREVNQRGLQASVIEKATHTVAAKACEVVQVC